MKKIFRHLDTSLVCSILFFCLMVTIGVATAHAQDTIRENTPLLYTTGPNVLGNGRIQWNNHIEYHHVGSTVGAYDYNSHCFGLATGFRFGIGSRAELTLDIEGQYCTFDNDHFHNTTGFTPSVGAMLLLYEGKGLLPQTAFYTHVATPVYQNAFNEKWAAIVQPEIGFQFRNRIGKSFLVDYSLGYSWNRYSQDDHLDFSDQVQYSLYLRWLHSERQITSIGVSNRNSIHSPTIDIETRRLLRDDLQLTMAWSISAGYSRNNGILDRVHGLAGISWMIK